MTDSIVGPLIDLRSDTVTKPTAAMRAVIAAAEVGDDMTGEDPTVNRLEKMVANLLDKEAAVYNCSGTQSNQMAIRAHCQQGDEILIAESGHIVNFEAGGAAALSGVTARCLPGKGGLLDVEDLAGKVRADNQHCCITRLVCVENTTNLGGGRVWPLKQMARVSEWSRSQGLKVHLDGARLFNATIAGGYTAREFARHADTVSICFSKGLGCPMGSILVGDAATIRLARRARKLFGGALRQAGMMAAAAIYALENHVERLREDHDNARAFAELIAGIDGIRLNVEEVETNLVFFTIDPELGTAAQLSARLLERGVRINPMGSHQLRACTHLDVDRMQVLEAAAAVRDCVQQGFSDVARTSSGPYASR
ncbi:threonine aldolase family protein [Schlesneria sp.]|uniref:threonine aldolase family protein n=1 Tax=Schlesneria sp. TaxID=2762018 RepID=UPI002F1353DB